MRRSAGSGDHARAKSLDYCPAYDATVGVGRLGPLRVLVRTRWPQLQNKLIFRYDLERILPRERLPAS